MRNRDYPCVDSYCQYDNTLPGFECSAIVPPSCLMDGSGYTKGWLVQEVSCMSLVGVIVRGIWGWGWQTGP